MKRQRLHRDGGNREDDQRDTEPCRVDCASWTPSKHATSDRTERCDTTRHYPRRRRPCDRATDVASPRPAARRRTAPWGGSTVSRSGERSSLIDQQRRAYLKILDDLIDDRARPGDITLAAWRPRTSVRRAATRRGPEAIPVIHPAWQANRAGRQRLLPRGEVALLLHAKRHVNRAAFNGARVLDQLQTEELAACSTSN